MTDSKDRDGTQSSSLTAQRIYEEIDQKPDEIRQRLVSILNASERDGISLWHENDADAGFDIATDRRSVVGNASLVGSNGDRISRASTRSSLTDGLKRYSFCIGKGELPAVYRKEKAARQQEVEDAMERMRNCGEPDSLTTISKHGGTPETNNMAGDDTRVEMWLHRGLFADPSAEADSMSLASKTPNQVSGPQLPSRSVVKSPTLSKFSKREVASPTSPLSPLNNGRDAYGNFIPTNTQDYITSKKPIISLSLRPVSGGSVQSKSQVSPSLRGGGGWWNTLGISPTGQESSGNNTPDQVSSNAKMSRSPMIAISSKRGRSAVNTDDWSDEESIPEEGQQSRPHEKSTSERIGGLHDRHRVRNTGTTVVSPAATPSTPIVRKPVGTLNNSPRSPLSPRMGTGVQDRAPESWTGLQAPRRVMVDTNERAESPLSEASHGARKNKRWNEAPSTVPPIRAPPPPPPMIDAGMSRSPDSYGRPLNRDRNARLYDDRDESGRYPICPIHESAHAPAFDESDDDNGFDLMSLQFGESVSVAGRPETSDGYPQSRISDQRIPAQEYYQQQEEAQAVFRGLCENVMKSTNTEMKRLRARLHSGEWSQTQFERHKGELFRNMNNSLRHCASEVGYVVSTESEGASSVFKHGSKALKDKS